MTFAFILFKMAEWTTLCSTSRENSRTSAKMEDLISLK
jgi:hypothetical protein